MRRITLRDEAGIALILAVLIMAVLLVTVTSMIAFTSSSSRDASTKKVGQQAYALAEAGANNALAQLASHYYDSSGNPTNTTTAYDSTWAISGSQQSATSTAACTTVSTCVTWGVTSWTVNGSSTGVTKGTVRIWGKGTAPNPGGPSLADISRTVSLNIDVTQPPAAVTAPDVFRMIYSGKVSTGCDFTMNQGVAVTGPLYVAGNLCAGNKGAVDSPGTLIVGGWVDLSGPNARIGTQASPLSSLTIVGSCVTQTSTPACPINSPGGKVWANPSGVHTSTAITPIASPVVDWTTIKDQSGTGTCSPSSVVLSGTFALTPQSANSDYTCTTQSGSIAWSRSNEKLTISGNVYINGDLNIDTQNNIVTYSGLGSIYVAGAAQDGDVTFANNSFICAAKTGSDCDFNNLANWDTSANFLLILSKNPTTGKNLHYQGGLYSASQIDLGSGQSFTQGPLVTPLLLSLGQQAGSGFPDIPVIVSGAPGTTNPPYVLGKPYGGSY